MMKSNMVLEEGGDRDNLELQSQISHKLNSSDNPTGQKSWTFVEMLGLDKCLDMFSKGRTPAERAANASMAAQVDAESTSSSFQVVKGMLPEWIAGKKQLSLLEHVKVLKEGALFWRRMPNQEKPLAVWLSLQTDEEETYAEIQWRNPQLVFNKPVDKDTIPFDAIRACRSVNASESSFFPEGSIASQTNGAQNCLVIASDSRSLVLEASNPEDKDRWVLSMQTALQGYVAILDDNKQKKMKDAHRIQELESRKKSRDRRRQEYSKAGMSNTARIMAEGARGGA